MRINIFLVLFLNFYVGCLYGQTPEKQSFYFANSPSSDSKGYFINSPDPFSEKKGFGFDLGTSKHINFEENAITSDKPFYFSVNLPEGNYEVEVDFGSDKNSSVTTVKAESRRLMLCQIRVEAGETKTKKFTVNRRGIQISSEESVNLKSREEDDLNWDQKLTLEFAGDVAVRTIHITPAEGYTTVFLAGDSTVTDQDVEPWASWGQMIPQFFTPDITVANYAASGEALNSFKKRKRLKKIFHEMQEGDYLFIEFGHNDAKIKGEGNGAYGLYTNLLKEYVNAAREKGGIPVLLTPTQRRHFDKEGKLQHTHGDFPDAMRKVANDLDVALIDLTEITTRMYESWGVEGSKSALVHYPANTFPGQEKELTDNTHFNVFGANEIALAIVEEIRNSNLELKKYIREDSPGYNPIKPNKISEWTVPASPRFESTKPEGN